MGNILMPLLLSVLLLACAVLVLRRTRPGVLASLWISLLCLLLLLLAGAHAVSDRFTGEGIDASVLYHLRMGFEGAGMMEYLGLMVATGILLLLSLLAAIVCFRLLQRSPPRASRMRALASGCLLLAAAIAAHPAPPDLYRLYRVQQDNLANTTPSGDYLTTGTVAPRRPANLVVLYLEGLERSYLDEQRFPGLTPNLRRLEQRATSFTDIRQVWSTSWTIAGITASQCGIPLVTPQGSYNAMSGTDRFLPEARCIGDVLAEAGYRLEFFGGADVEFAGKGGFLREHGFARANGIEQLQDRVQDPSYRSHWGLYDDTLLGLLHARLRELARSPQPFAVFALTLDTHVPEGHVPAACAGLHYRGGEQPILDAVHCADRLAGAFIDGLLADPALKDSVLLVQSDHLMMQTAVSGLLEQAPRRNLMMLFDPSREPSRVDTPGSLLDVAPTLLNRLGADLDGFGYGRDLLGESPSVVEQHGEQVDDFLISQFGFLRSLWSFPQLYAGLELGPDDRLSLGEREIKLPALLNLGRDLQVLDIHFEIDADNRLAQRMGAQPATQRFVWVDRCAAVAALSKSPIRAPGQQWCLSAGTLGGSDIRITALEPDAPIAFADLKQAFDAGVVDTNAYPQRRSRLQAWLRYGDAFVTEVRLPSPQADTSVTVLHSVGSPSAASEARVPPTGQHVTLRRGLTLLGLDPAKGPIKLAHIDSCDSSEAGRVVDESA
ncbi:MAG TPA: sulfatase-like hydrolase/transferase, partial [Arenimonas sp.]|nr:sulfatase-like hydrolase/transferase [Arenimonas sp.]